jgi:DNA invertase Pin-like site-specific DNA recombinase
MKVVLYSRTSTKKQNINEQLLSLVKICDDNDWDISKSFKDYGISGLVSEREGLSDLINFCLNNKVDKVLVTELSRLSRDKEQLKELISTLYEVGTSIYFSGLKIETLINNNINQNCLTIIYNEIDFANREVLKIRSRFERGYNSYISNGGKVGRKVGFRFTEMDLILKHEDVVKLLQIGVSVRSIMSLTGKSSPTVQKIKKILKNNNTLSDVKPMKTTDVLKRVLENPNWIMEL